MDKQFLYLRVRTDSSIKQTPNPNENYVLIYPVIQSQKANLQGSSLFSIHLRDSNGQIYKMQGGDQQKILQLQDRFSNLERDLILILREIVGGNNYFDSDNSNSLDNSLSF